MDEQIKKRINDLLVQHKVFLFMKGTASFPQCGFSSRVVEALKQTGVEFGYFDVLEDNSIRQGIKDYSQWPTIPQLYVNKELIGGCDIVVELFEKGELKQALQA